MNGRHSDRRAPQQQAARRAAAMPAARTKKCGPCQTRRLTGTAWGAWSVTGGLIRRSCNL